MDAPAPQEDCRPFVAVAHHLEAMHLNAPRVLAADLDRGFLLLTDLGRTPYLAELQERPESADRLYGDAIAALITMHAEGGPYQAQLPPYDAELLDFELSLFHDWLCGTHVGLKFSTDDEMAWRDLTSLLIRNALDQPRVFVHRDYHSRNLMLTDVGNPGILDFQDAVEGPVTYDLVSLLRDCYVRWPQDRVRQWALDFHAGSELSGTLDEDQFLRAFDLMGVQRHLKAAGIFARLNHRDGKAGYLDDIPRTLQYIVDLGTSYDELKFLTELICTRVLPVFEAST